MAIVNQNYEELFHVLSADNPASFQQYQAYLSCYVCAADQVHVNVLYENFCQT